MAAKFEVFADKGGKYRFRLKAANGEIVLSSQAYASKESCSNGIASVQKNAANPDLFSKTTSEGGKFGFSLLAANKQVIGTSQTYSSAPGRDNGIKSVGKAATGASIVDQT
jgi:uncharacterized protein YegP (UPF0339 family)